MKLRTVITAACAVALFFSTGPSMSQDRGAEIILVSLDGAINYNYCTSEDLMFSGTFQIVQRLEGDATGGVHGMTNTSARNLTAIGLTTGQSYKIVGVDPIRRWIVSQSGTQIVMYTSRFAFVSKSADANAFLTYIFREVTNANGARTVEYVTSWLDCR